MPDRPKRAVAALPDNGEHFGQQLRSFWGNEKYEKYLPTLSEFDPKTIFSMHTINFRMSNR
jgi:hypothetical protein